MMRIDDENMIWEYRWWEYDNILEKYETIWAKIEDL